MDSWTSLSSAYPKNDGWCKPTSEQGRGLFLAILPWRSFCRLCWILDNMRSNGGFWQLSSDVSFWFLMILFFFAIFCVIRVLFPRRLIFFCDFEWFRMVFGLYNIFLRICVDLVPWRSFSGGGLWSNGCCFPAYPLLIHHLGLSSG